MLLAFDLWVRLKSDRASHVEVNGYRYSSRLAGARKRNVTGASSYLALLRKASGVEVEVTDIGDLAPGGRSEVKLAVVNEGPRLRLEARVVIESDGVVASSSQESVWLAPGSAKRLYLPYEITESGEYTLCIFGRDGDSGRLLFSFKGCDAEVMEQLAARSSGRGTS
jgi:hypothetical protein